jgi:hypothetical protein
MTYYTPDGFIILRRCDYSHRRAKQRIGTTDFCTEHLLMKLLELEEPTGMKLVKIAIGNSNNNNKYDN